MALSPCRCVDNTELTVILLVKLSLLKIIPGTTADYAAVYKNFENDIYTALCKATEQFLKYHTLKIIFPLHTYYPVEILKGFKNYCQG